MRKEIIFVPTANFLFSSREDCEEFQGDLNKTKEMDRVMVNAVLTNAK